MQDEVIFPAFGIDGPKFWTRCTELVRDNGYDNELAYMKVLLDTLGMDRPKNGIEKTRREIELLQRPARNVRRISRRPTHGRTSRSRRQRRALHHLFRDEDFARWQP